MLQWAHANGFPWDVMTCANAAMGGHLEVLQCWRATDCPWDWHTYVHKSMDGKLRNWAVAKGCPQR